MIIAMGAILACWMLGWATVVGWGLWVQRLPIFRGMEVSLSRAAWLGLTACVVVLEVLHFWVRIGGAVSGTLAIVGIAGLIVHQRALLARLRARPLSWTQILVTLVAGLWIARSSMAPRGDIDTMLYHLQSVRWTQAYPLVVGIGNLHGRLAFNPAIDLVFAALASGPWSAAPTSVGNGFMWMLLLGQGLRYWSRGRRPEWRGMQWFGVAFVPAMMAWAYHLTGSLLTDMAPFAMVAIAVAWIVEALLVEERAELLRGTLIAAGWIALGAVVMKLSTVACASGILGVCLWLAAPGDCHRVAGWLALAGVLLLVPWVTRNVVMSGCLVYPVAATRLSVSWAMPLGMIHWEAYAIHVYAKWDGWPPPEAAAGGLIFWLKRFVRVSFFEYAVGWFPAAVGAAFWWQSDKKFVRRSLPLLIIPLVLGVLFWFFTAPTWRFLGPVVWLFAALGAARFGASRRAMRPGSTFAAAIGFSLIMGLGSGWTLLHADWMQGAQLQYLIDDLRPPTTPGRDHPPIRSVETDSGLTVYVPADGAIDPPLENHPYTHDVVGDAPLPASPYAHPGLRLRKPGDLAGGFEIASSSDPAATSRQ